MRDIDLHPDAHIAKNGSPGIVQRAKRGLHEGIEDRSRKLQRAKDAAQEGAQSLHDAAAAAAQVAAEKVAEASRKIGDFEDTADERLRAVEDAVGATVGVLQAQAANALQSVHEQAATLEQAVEAGVNTLQENVSTAVYGAVWGAMSYMAPRLKWSSYGSIGFNGPSPSPASKPKVRVPTFAEVKEQAEKLDAEDPAVMLRP